MRTLVIIEVEHKKPIPALANMIAGRAYTIDGVVNAELLNSPLRPTQRQQDDGFSLSELSLGSQEVHRS